MTNKQIVFIVEGVNTTLLFKCLLIYLTDKLYGINVSKIID